MAGRYASLMMMVCGLFAVIAVCYAAPRFDESDAGESVELVEREVEKQGTDKSELHTVSRGATHYAYCNCTGTDNCCTCGSDEITGTRSARLSAGATHRFIFTCQSDTYHIGDDRGLSKSSIVSCTSSFYDKYGHKSVAGIQCMNWKVRHSRSVTYTSIKCWKD